MFTLTLRVFLSFCLIFCQLQPCVAYDVHLDHHKTLETDKVTTRSNGYYNANNNSNNSKKVKKNGDTMVTNIKYRGCFVGLAKPAARKKNRH